MSASRWLIGRFDRSCALIVLNPRSRDPTLPTTPSSERIPRAPLHLPRRPRRRGMRNDSAEAFLHGAAGAARDPRPAREHARADDPSLVDPVANIDCVRVDSLWGYI